MLPMGTPLVEPHSLLLHDAEDDETLVAEPAWNGDGPAFQISECPDGVIFAHNDRAAVTVPQIDDADWHSLRPQGYCHRRYHKRGLHFIRDQSLLDFGKPLKHSGEKNVSRNRTP